MNPDIYQIVSILKPFSDTTVLKVATALYQLTVYSEDSYATIPQISEKSGLSEEKVEIILLGDLLSFITEKQETTDAFRINGMYMNILPILSLLDFKCSCS